MRNRPFSAVLLCLLLACTSIKPLVLSARDSGKTIEMVQGQELVLNFEADRSQGYRWWLVDSNPIVLLPTERPSFEANPGATNGAETWRFKAAQAGKQTLRFEYKRSADETPAKTLTYAVNVVK